MDVEKTIQFILEQQAQFWSAIHQLRQDHQSLAQDQRHLLEIQSRQQEMIGGLGEIVRQLATEQRNSGLQMQELREAQRQTEQNLNALIKVVDDLIRRNGRH